MGNGASSADVELHLRRWESAVTDINALCNSHRRQMGGGGAGAVAAEVAFSDHAGGTGGSAFGRATLGVEDADADGDKCLKGRRASSISFQGNGGGQRSNNNTNNIATSGGPVDVVLLGHQQHNDSIADRGGEARTPGKGLDFVTHESECQGVDVSMRATVSGAARHNRQQVMEARKARTAQFKSYVDQPIADLAKGKLACDHFATVAIALTVALGGNATTTDRKARVTVEDIFFAAHVPLHLVHKEGLCLTELYDTVREFIDVDNRFKGFQVEVLYLDIAPTIGQVEVGANDVGDRQSKLQLPQFIKTVQHEVEETNAGSVMILNYDPFILEQETMMDCDDDDDEENSSDTDENATSGAVPISARGVAGLLSNPAHDPLMMSTVVVENEKGSGKARGRYRQINKGAYAVAVECRQSVSTMITLCKGVADEKVHGEFEEVPINTLYKAMTSHAAGERARGYLRISKIKGPDGADIVSESITAAREAALNEDMELFYTPELASGKVIGSLAFGTHAHTISSTFSAHLVGLAWALHLIHGASAETQNYGKGLPIGDIIRTLALPSDVYLSCDLSLEQVYLYAKSYLAKKGYDKEYALLYCPIFSHTARENAAPNIAVFDLERIMLDVAQRNTNKDDPQSIMLLQYNAEIAHNVLGVTTAPQWCVLAGYDAASQMATMIDSNMQTFSGKWTCPLDRLHKAITAHGYLVLNKGAARADEAGRIGRFMDTASGRIRAATDERIAMVNAAVLPDYKSTAFTFCFPSKPFAPTLMALTLSNLGLEDATFDTVVSRLPFHPSSVLDGHFGLSALLICFNKYLRSVNKINSFTFEPTYFDPNTKPTQEEFVAMLKSALAEKEDPATGNKCLMVLHYDHKNIKILGSREPFGDYGLLTGITEDSVIVTDTNPNRFYRTWQVSVESLYAAVGYRSHASRRSRGVIKVTHLAVEKSPHQPSFSRSLTLLAAPIQNIFLVSPSPQIQALSIAFSQLGHYHSPEEIFYEAYLKTMEDQRRRGSQAFAWRDVDVSLAILNKKIDRKVMASVARKFIESRKVQNLAATHLADVEEEMLPEMLCDACSNTADHLLLLNYDAAAHHGLPGMGSSVAIVKSFDTETMMVTLFDCEYCLFGLEWSCTVDALVKAADLDNAGASKYGFVKITASAQGKRAGIGLAGSKPQEGAAAHATREKVASFV